MHRVGSNFLTPPLHHTRTAVSREPIQVIDMLILIGCDKIWDKNIGYYFDRVGSNFSYLRPDHELSVTNQFTGIQVTQRRKPVFSAPSIGTQKHGTIWIGYAPTFLTPLPTP